MIHRVGLVTICGLFLFGLISLLFTPTHSVEIGGTLATHRAEPSQSSSRRYLAVRLDDGTTVQARVYGQADYKPGHRIILKEVTSRCFCYKWYLVERYVEEPADNDRFLSHG